MLESMAQALAMERDAHQSGDQRPGRSRWSVTRIKALTNT
jgi:hypothetical protein